MRPLQSYFIQRCDHVSDAESRRLGDRIMRLVAETMPAVVNKDSAVIPGRVSLRLPIALTLVLGLPGRLRK
jgi:hypothetical protein